MKKKIIIKVFIAIGIILLIIGILDALSLFGESFPTFYIFLLVGILLIVIPALSLDSNEPLKIKFNHGKSRYRPKYDDLYVDVKQNLDNENRNVLNNDDVICPKCKAINESEDIICKVCGNALKIKKCKYCGKEMEAFFTHCINCGKQLEK